MGRSVLPVQPEILSGTLAFASFWGDYKALLDADTQAHFYCI